MAKDEEKSQEVLDAEQHGGESFDPTEAPEATAGQPLAAGVCPNCKGDGLTSDGRLCANCEGRGKL